MKREADNKRNESEEPLPAGSRASIDHPPSEHSHREAGQKWHERPRWRDRRDWMRFVVEIGMLLAVLWYASVASKQWGEMVRLNVLTERASEKPNETMRIPPKPPTMP
jgi:hypothetical protein